MSRMSFYERPDQIAYCIDEAQRALPRLLDSDGYIFGTFSVQHKSVRVVDQDPYTFVEFTIKDQESEKKYHVVGISKRNPKDLPNVQRGISVATFRAIRRFIKDQIWRS